MVMTYYELLWPELLFIISLANLSDSEHEIPERLIWNYLIDLLMVSQLTSNIPIFSVLLAVSLIPLPFILLFIHTPRSSFPEQFLGI